MFARAVEITVCVGLAIACPAQREAEREPNNSAAQAQRLVAGQQLAARLTTTADTDWYRFTLDTEQRVNLRAIPASTALPWAPSDMRVAIYDRSGEQRLAWNERCVGNYSNCGLTLPAGDYTCLVALQPTGSPGDYVLDFVADAPRPIDVAEAPEPNDNPAAGGAPTTFRLGDTIGGEIARPGDVDWFCFELTRPGIVQAVCLDDGGAPQLDSTRLQLWRETSPGLWSVRSVPSFTRNSHRVFDLDHTTNLPAANTLPAGRYAIQVDADLPAPTGAAPWDYRRVGKYALRTALIDLPGTHSTAEASEPNDTAGNATPLQLGDDATGAVVGPGDADWFRFETTAPVTIGATAEGRGPGALAVASLRLCDAQGQALASGTATSSAHGKLVHTLAEPGVYFLEVKGRLFTDAGSYLLHTGGTVPTFVDRAPHRERNPEAAEASAPAETAVRDTADRTRSH